MSIELTGPKKYKFQDQVCALLAMLFVNETGASLQIEPQDGEDALLTLNKDGKAHFIEIQVKGAKELIGPESLAGWLTHFPANQATGSLLERISAEAKRSVLFIASGRCNDVTVDHTITLPNFTESIKKSKIKKNTEQAIRAALESYAVVTPTKEQILIKSRRTHIGNWLSCISTVDLKEVIQRVLIVEQLDDTDILRLSKEALLLNQVVPDQVEKILGQIESIIFVQKRTGRNVLPEVLKVITSGKARDPLLANTYVHRDEEAMLLDQLSREHSILITGAPRVGKSFCARSIAYTLQRQGYIVRICDDLAQADRFLTEPVSELRVALVDDPFGGAHAAENAALELQILEGLIPKLTNGKGLIVVQAENRLLEVTRLKTLDEITTAGKSWISIGIGDASFLTKVWTEAAQAYAVSITLRDQIADAIASSALGLEPGCLVHLATNHSRLKGGAKIDDVIRFARQDSKSLGSALRQEQLEPILTALAVASTQELYVGERELAFALDKEREDRPGFTNVVGTMTNYSISHTEKTSPALSYNTPFPVLSQKALESLEHLELRRIVAANGGRYTFSHPFYRASAESLLDAATSRSTTDAILLVDRAIFCISADTAKATATNLGWIYHNLNSQVGKVGIIDIAFKGLSSIFPVIRDICFQFLIRRLSSLPIEQQQKISTWVQKVTFPKLSYIEWVGDQPQIPAATFADILEVGSFPPIIAFREVEETLNLLNSDRPDFVSNEAMARAAMYIQEHPDTMTKQMAARLLSSDVSLIRAPAAGTWLSRTRNDDSMIVEQIISEQHPAVAKAAYLGVLEAWPSCDDERRRMLTESMQKMVESPTSAVVLIGQLVVIDREEYGGVTTPWQLFEALAPIVLRKLPPGASFSDARLYAVMKSAVGKISQSSLLEIVDRWIEFIEEYSSNDIPSDYMLGVSDILIAGVAKDSGKRTKWIERLLKLPGTACRIRVVSDLIDSWTQLSEREQSLLLQHLAADTLDKVWVQAAALTRITVPNEIESLILPGGVNLSSPSDEIFARISSELLNACLHVFTGIHPAIYYIGTHVASSYIWEPIVQKIARLPTHLMFEPCWEWLARSRSTQLSDVANELGSDHFERLVNLLLERKQRTTGEFFPTVWDALFTLPISEAVKSDWIARMAAIAPKALDSLDEYKNWIPESHREEFLSHFENDLNIYKILQIFHQAKNDNLIPKDQSPSIVELLSTLIETAPPKHWSTYDAILNYLRILDIKDQHFIKNLNVKRSKDIEIFYTQPKQLVPELLQWVGRF